MWSLRPRRSGCLRDLRVVRQGETLLGDDQPDGGGQVIDRMLDREPVRMRRTPKSVDSPPRRDRGRLELSQLIVLRRSRRSRSRSCALPGEAPTKRVVGNRLCPPGVGLLLPACRGDDQEPVGAMLAEEVAAR
jgi:hypothetical protein